eukprot:364615-Chlamydomonas_euryale.AAC.12
MAASVPLEPHAWGQLARQPPFHRQFSVIFGLPPRSSAGRWRYACVATACLLPCLPPGFQLCLDSRFLLRLADGSRGRLASRHCRCGLAGGLPLPGSLLLELLLPCLLGEGNPAVNNLSLLVRTKSFLGPVSQPLFQSLLSWSLS